ncbi:MAG: hypothetical protein R3C53_26325 [Pirellulaceae bacterium]
MSRFLRLAVGCVFAVGLCSGRAQADLVITMNVLGGGTEVSITGSGTLSGSGATGPGAVLTFNNFSNNPFLADFPRTSGTGPGFNFVFTNVGTRSLVNLQLIDQTGGDDIRLELDGTSGPPGTAYTVSGSQFFAGLGSSQLNPGSYFASLTAGDASFFDSVQLNIVSAVPEPSSLALVGMMGCVVFCADACNYRILQAT